MIEKLKELAERAKRSDGLLDTEEATKNALVMPFIAALGYDVFDPTEVVPEFTCDHGTKKGEKVDYAIRRDEEVVMLFEAKKADAELNLNHASQLFRYFSVTTARIGVLTNGYCYRFFSDLDEANKMDDKPFMELDVREPLDPAIARELTKLTKSEFDLDTMLEAANDLKYLSEIRREIEAQLRDPGEEFVKYFFSRANPSGRFVQSVRDQFSSLVKQAFHSVITERVSERLRSALEHESIPNSLETPEIEADPAPEEGDGGDIVTTEDELDGYRTVRAIVSSVLSPERVTYRDSKSYFAVICDDNNRKPICRLHFNRSQKYLGVFDEEKKETRHPLEKVSNLYQFSDALREAATRYAADASAN